MVMIASFQSGMSFNALRAEKGLMWIVLVVVCFGCMSEPPPNLMWSDPSVLNVIAARQYSQELSVTFELISNVSSMFNFVVF